MSIRPDGAWVAHQVDATAPDGRRISIEVLAKERHTGSVSVKWDPTGMAEARFVGGGSGWLLRVIVVVVVAAIAVAAWQIFF